MENGINDSTPPTARVQWLGYSVRIYCVETGADLASIPLTTAGRVNRQWLIRQFGRAYSRILNVAHVATLWCERNGYKFIK